MKNQILAALFIVTVVSLVIQPNVNAMSKGGGKSVPFGETAGWKKADLRLRQAWQEAVDNKEENTVLECMLKTTQKVSDAEKRTLKDTGFLYRTVIGRIVTGSMKAKDVPAVANLDFIEVIELSAPMSLKKKDK